MVQSTATVLEERGKRYGRFMSQAQIAQSIHIVLEQGMQLVGKNRFDFAPDQLEAINMIVNKIGRIYNGDPNYSDSWRDIAGYATLVADRLDNDNTLREQAEQQLIEAENERNRDAEEARPDSPDNEPNRPEGRGGFEQNQTTDSPSRPDGQSTVRRLPVRLEVQDGIHSATSQTTPGVPVHPGE